MIKLNLPLKFTALALATFISITAFSPAKATTFDETQVEQTNFIAVAQPFGENKYNLIVIEQIPNKQACWSETGSNPVNVDILLLNFDFSGHCLRSTDANGYSIRFNGQDLGLDYILNLVQRNGQLELIGINRKDPRQPELVVGTTQGLIGTAMKIQLNPGWRFSKRTYNGKILGHVYFSYTDEQATMDAPNSNNANPNNPKETMQEIIAPETPTNDNMMNKNQPVKENSQSMLNDKEISNTEIINIQPINNTQTPNDNAQTNKKNYGLTSTRFDRIKNH